MPAQPHIQDVPGETASAQSLKAVREIYQADYAKTATADKTRLAQMLLATGISTTDNSSDKFVLLSEARRLAMEAGDAQTALQAVYEIAHSFAVDVLAWRVQTLEALSKATLGPEDVAIVTDAWIPLINDQIVHGDFAQAVHSLSEFDFAARRGADPARLKLIDSRIQNARDTLKRYERDKGSIQQLQNLPVDPGAASEAGEFFCFYANDWKQGLGLLKQGKVPALAQLAAKDLATGPDPATMADTGDAWWDYASTQAPEFKQRIENRAIAWYEEAMPKLTGLSQARIKQRLAGVHSNKLIEFVPLIDTTKDTVWGIWKSSDVAITVEAKGDGLLQLPYVPAEEYDYRIEFDDPVTRPCLSQLLFCAGRQFTWSMGGYGGEIMGLQYIGGPDVTKSPTQTKQLLPIAERCSCEVQVRKDGIHVVFNGKNICNYKTNYQNFGLPGGGRIVEVGLSTHLSKVRFYHIEVVEVTGVGAITRHPR